MHVMQSDDHGYPDGSEYRGHLREQDGLRHGDGSSLKQADGSLYCGQFENGMFQGLGILTLPDGSTYEGQFVKGKFHGLGVYTGSNGLKYQGEFMEGKVWGKGQIIFQDGSSGQPSNEGYFENFVLKKRQNCQTVVEKANQMAINAKTKVQQR